MIPAYTSEIGRHNPGELVMLTAKIRTPTHHWSFRMGTKQLCARQRFPARRRNASERGAPRNTDGNADEAEEVATRVGAVVCARCHRAPPPAILFSDRSVDQLSRAARSVSTVRIATGKEECDGTHRFARKNTAGWLSGGDDRR
ncbi:hypothetical protein HPB48_005303 [Haemaphysalis longicornis]|uniref:Uncharacterized protein n=1 Tax=Haemaphysalis longicornis TaxID=44386 RepID=A0A9J6GF48_HAELO|nr:hypothetical protein HPB48_005303 [Haemaphysalis longicornis]